MSAGNMAPDGGKGKSRSSISKKRRFDIFKRDAFTCQYCGRKPPAVVLELEHVIPVCEGGADDDTNLLCSCFDCNRGKGGTPLDIVPLSVVDRLAHERELVEQVHALNQFQAEQREFVEATIDELGIYWNDHTQAEKGVWIFGDDRKKSARHFLKFLTPSDVKEAIDLAMFRSAPSGTYDRKTWLYFCKVCWNWIKEGKPQ